MRHFGGRDDGKPKKNIVLLLAVFSYRKGRQNGTLPSCLPFYYVFIQSFRLIYALRHEYCHLVQAAMGSFICPCTLLRTSNSFDCIFSIS